VLSVTVTLLIVCQKPRSPEAPEAPGKLVFSGIIDYSGIIGQGENNCEYVYMYCTYILCIYFVCNGSWVAAAHSLPEPNSLRLPFQSSALLSTFVHFCPLSTLLSSSQACASHPFNANFTAQRNNHSSSSISGHPSASGLFH